MTFAKHTESKLPAYKSHFDIYAIYEDWTDKHKSVLKEFKEWYKEPDNALPWLTQKIIWLKNIQNILVFTIDKHFII